MKLNWDVLRAVMEVLASEDLACAMFTCRTLYQLGMPLLFPNVSYTHGKNHYLLYHHLLLSDPSQFTRITTLRSTYTTQSPSPKAATRSLFPDFLRLATSLRELDLSFRSDAEIDDTTYSLLGSLSGLRSLCLRCCPVFTFLGLRNSIKAPLTSLAIYQEYPEWNSPHGHHTMYDPFPFLTEFRTSLTSLALHVYAKIRLPYKDITSQIVVFPLVEDLYWHSLQSVYDAAALATVFPAVKRLDVARHLTATASPPHAHEAAAARQRGLTYPQWHAAHQLQHVRGNLPDLWTLGLRCRVTRLELHLIWQPIPAPPGHVRAVVHALAPVTLRADFVAPWYVLHRGALDEFVHDGLRALHLAFALPDAFLLYIVSLLVRLFPPLYRVCLLNSVPRSRHSSSEPPRSALALRAGPSAPCTWPSRA